MRQARTRATVGAAALALTLTLVGCTADQAGVAASGPTASESVSPSAAPSTDPAPAMSDNLSDNLSAALATIPATASMVALSDEAAKLNRWDLTRPLSTSDDDFKTYLTESMKMPSADHGQLASSLVTMQEGGWGWSWLDVDWAATVTEPKAPPVGVVKLRDDLDMSVVTASMDDAYTRSGPDDRPVYAFDLKNGGSGVPYLTGAVVLPDKHLIVSGSDPADVLAAIDGTAPSLADDPAVSALLAPVGAAEFVTVQLGADACIDPAALMIGSELTPAEAEKILSSFISADLAQVTGVAVATLDSESGMVVARYEDSETATEDEPKRVELLTEGKSLATQQPYSELLGTPTITVADDTLLYEFDDLDPAARLYQMVLRRDAPWAFC